MELEAGRSLLQGPGDLPTNIIDLYAEDALRINGRQNMLGKKAGAKLIYAMHRNGSRIPTRTRGAAPKAGRRMRRLRHADGRAVGHD